MDFKRPRSQQRLAEFVRALQADPNVTALELAARFKLGRRTAEVYRVEAARRAGLTVPIFTRLKA